MSPISEPARRTGIERAVAIYGHVPALALWRAVELEMWDEVMDTAAGIPGGRILDVACGPGLFTSQLGLAVKPVGLDLEAELTRLAERSGVYSRVVTANACEMPFPEGAFAFAFSNSSLEHVRGVERLFGEVARVLAPGGTFAFIVPTSLFGEALLRPRLLRAVGMRARAERARESVLRDTDTFNRFSREHWCALVNAGGLEVLAVTAFMPSGTIRLWEVLHYLYTKPILGRRISDLARGLGEVHARVSARLLAGSVRRGRRSENGVQILVIARKPS